MHIGHIVHPVILTEKGLQHLVVGKAGPEVNQIVDAEFAVFVTLFNGNSLLYHAQTGLSSATLFSSHQTQDMNIIRLPNLSHTEIVKTLKDTETMLAVSTNVKPAKIIQTIANALQKLQHAVLAGDLPVEWAKMIKNDHRKMPEAIRFIEEMEKVAQDADAVALAAFNKLVESASRTNLCMGKTMQLITKKAVARAAAAFEFRVPLPLG